MFDLIEALEHCTASLEHLMAFKGSRLEEQQRDGHLLNIERARRVLSRLHKKQIPMKLRTLIEDFDNPCFGGKLHNEIPHQIGLMVIDIARGEKLEQALRLYPDRLEHHEARAEEIRTGKRKP